MAATDVFARRATLARSLRLLSQFRFEQPDPARFYGALAEDTAAMVADLWRRRHGDPPAGRTLLDVGGGPGYFAAAFADAGLALHRRRTRSRARCTRRARAVDGGHGHLRPGVGHGAAVRRRQRGHLPVVQRRRARAAAVAAGRRDAAGHQARRAGRAVVHGVARPVRRPRDGADALPRRRPGRRRATPASTAIRPKNDYGSSLFAVSAADGLDWAASTGALVAAFPRYHPRWAWWMTRVPVLREFLVSNLVLVLRPP